MKRIIVICSLLIIGLNVVAQFQIPMFGRGVNEPTETPAQYVTRQYILLNNIQGANAYALKNCTRSLENAGLYYKIAKLTIYNWWNNGKSFNYVSPINYNGAFTDSVKAGTIATVTGGIQLSSGDTINTYLINDLMSNAPYIGYFYYTPQANVDDILFYSLSPFRGQARFGGKAYVSIWSSPSGASVPVTPSGFLLGQRINADSVEFYQGISRYIEATAINSKNPTNNTISIIGNSTAPFNLYVSGICQALTPDEVANLKAIIEQLLTDLGII